jgi:hypothetical protein
MASVKRSKNSRHSHASKNPSNINAGQYPPSDQQSSEKPLSPVIRRSAINNLVGNNSQSSTGSSTDKSSAGPGGVP